MNIADIIKSIPAKQVLPIVLVILSGMLFLASMTDTGQIAGVSFSLSSQVLKLVFVATGAVSLLLAVLLAVVTFRGDAEASPVDPSQPAAPADIAAPSEVDVRDGSALIPASGILTMDEAKDFGPRQLLEDAYEIRIFSRTIVNVLNGYSRQIADVLKAGGSVKIVVMEPDDEIGDRLYPSAATPGREVLRGHARTVQTRLRYIAGEAGANAAARLEVKVTNCVPSFGMMLTRSRAGRASGRMTVQMNFLYTRTERDRPLMLFVEGDRWFSAFEKEFDAVWQHAKEWDELSWTHMVNNQAGGSGGEH